MDTTTAPVPAGWLSIRNGDFPQLINLAMVVSVWRDHNHLWHAEMANGGSVVITEAEVMQITGFTNQQMWDKL